MDNEIVVASQYRGPPSSGNGGYVCGLLADTIGGVVTGILRAPIPLDTPLRLTSEVQTARLTSADGNLIAEARAGDASTLPTPPPPPAYDLAKSAGQRFVGLRRPFHPICFTCADGLAEGVGLRVFTGPVDGDLQDGVAGTWTPHAAFADRDGLARLEVIWAALDCPGSVAWLERGGQGGLLGTMTGEVLRRPPAGEPLPVIARLPWGADLPPSRLASGVCGLPEL